MAETLLAVESLSAGYDEALVLHEVGFALAEGETLALLGRNGMGKSTLLATIMGHTRRHAGAIRFAGRDIARIAPHLRARMGLAWVAQEREIFSSLTVTENLTVAARPGAWTVERVYAFFPRLRERRASMGNQLSGGEQQMLAIGRALTTNPRLILLDEPLEGLAPVIAEQIAQAIRRMNREEKLTTILVEQHAQIALGLADQAICLERGRIAYAGAAAALANDLATLDRLVGVRKEGARAISR